MNIQLGIDHRVKQKEQILQAQRKIALARKFNKIAFLHDARRNLRAAAWYRDLKNIALERGDMPF